MNEERRKILDMLAQGQINADEAERLIAPVDPRLHQPRPVTRAEREQRDRGGVGRVVRRVQPLARRSFR